ncbi:MAG: bifunctional methylenetetrahydrofolate dehydrogenase/methenyltetrahydrofolate cyclohydrolase FolD [bacterium]
MSQIIDGKSIAKQVRDDVAKGVELFKAESGITPCLNVILVGDDPASQVYVRNKEKACVEVGIKGETIRMPAVTSEKELIAKVNELNNRSDVHGILVQLPVPVQISALNVLQAISPDKDVDGLHIVNMGKLLKGEKPPFISCTPAGIIELILSTGAEIKGQNAVVIGRSNIVGKPMALLLLERHATVTICHSRTKELPGVCRQADILVAAVGRAKMVRKDWVKPGAVVIDVGMNRDENNKLCGDVDFDDVKDVAGFITPVPGGVGPMTIAMLLRNTLKSAQLSV